MGVLFLALGVASFARVACLPSLLKMSSAAGLNLALLATDFYAIMAGVAFFGYKVRKKEGTELPTF